MDTKGSIFDIQRFSLHDGPGIRTTVFFKGCPLRCVWCHNPESIARSPELAFYHDKCIHCGACVAVCEFGAHVMENSVHSLKRDLCVVCGKCVAECSVSALELIGREVGVDEIISEALKDVDYYKSSSGGLTVSGGEPLMQPVFLKELLSKARSSGLHICVETCGYTAWTALNSIIDFVDIFLFDIKETDPVLHKEYTGVSNELILSNLRRLHDSGSKIILRLPIIPRYNDRDDHFDGISGLCKELPDIVNVEIMPYHTLGENKISQLGHDGTLRATSEPPAKEQVNLWKKKLYDKGVKLN
ncbi:MAG: glycyl-radical enzyme activating protein [Lentisphaerae bacterium]|nr:glycyl-radical enzyme activating protein [Lentisphaerota bacterium]